MNSKKVLISGYYGFDNFGDDAILYVLISDIKKHAENSEIVVISNNPEKIKQNYGVNSVYKFDFKEILRHMKTSDLFISGGGSLLQDVTSFKSLIYYLSLIFLAEMTRVRTFIYAQGVGPIRSKSGRILTSLVLKRANQITVRDRDSQEFLKSLGINSIMTSDPVWTIEKQDIDKSEINLDNDKIKVGVQLRGWKSLNTSSLENIAKSLNSNFNDSKYQLVLISLQDQMDFDITKQLEQILKSISPSLDIRIESELSIFNSISLISQLDYLIGMRFHADLISIKFNIPTFALSYDPKVQSLAEDAGIPYINVDSISEKDMSRKIGDFISDREVFTGKLKDFSAKKEIESRQNVDLLIKMLMS